MTRFISFLMLCVGMGLLMSMLNFRDDKIILIVLLFLGGTLGMIK